ncbi:MAG: translation initiation factor IF-2 [Cryomorphaceae bacterium MED-G14]|nr:MAG: translation initiation factor IF-2 [Cryomorphaceae bacterium MED-G14]|tara:strand:+ start:1329 stop:3875 length:2547 start_codon:yes stop_codon:yes gene_type:complete
MSDLNKIRLNKVVREFNISLERVVEFLSSKGHSIEARPTTKISTSQYDLLLSEFKSDRSSKVESHDLTEEKLKEKEELRIKFERDQEKNKNRIITSKSSIHKFKKIGEIDLEKKTPKQDLEIKNDVKIFNSKEDDNEKVFEKNESKIHTKYEKLSGLKKTGEKINLEKFNKPDSENDSAKNKRKRRRIAKDIINQKDSSKITIDKQNKSRNVAITPTDDEVQKQIKETLEKLQTSKSKAAKYRKEKRDTHKKRSEDQEKTESEKKVIKVTEFITVSEVATMMDVSGNDIISACMSLGIMVTMNQRLDAETLSVVADEFGFEVDFVTAEIEESINVNSDLPEDLLPRPPIVTVMGHVDHGKTSLLDFIRKENVIAGESGGITQHIGAYSVKLKNDNKITFLDTPGHEAFTAMRARGTQLTDIVVIVIAADDDIMPQTKEAISHAQAAGVPIIFAINKIDRDVANPEKIKEKLSGMNLLVEEWGGKIQSHDISALKGIGVDELLEKILLESEMLELKANPNKAPSGSVIEARLDKGKGYISTLLVQTGTLNIGDYILAGQYSGKVKALYDERGHQIKSAGPSMPVSVLGLDGAPQAGDKFNVFVDEKEAKQIAAKRTQLVREQSVRTQKHITLDEIGRRIAIGDFKELNIILKGDVDGSVEALSDSFQKLSTDEIIVNIIHKAVGAITESDILLASASDAIVIGFNVRPSGNARSIADKEEVDIRNYSIIYDAINDLKDAMEGLLSPELREELTGTAEIRETFKISKIGTIAGCMVMNGKISRKSKVRLIREGIVITTTELSSLKRFQDDVKDVSKGYDCGIQLKNYNDIKVGDVLECFNELKVKKKLKK